MKLNSDYSGSAPWSNFFPSFLVKFYPFVENLVFVLLVGDVMFPVLFYPVL